MSTLTLKPGTRLRTGGTSYEVQQDASIPANVVPVIPQSTRMLKVFCGACGYTCRVTSKWLTKAGAPLCPCGHGVMVVELKPEKDAPAAVKPPRKAATPPTPEPDVPVGVPVTVTLTDPADEWLAEPEPEPAPTAEEPSTLARLLAEL